MTATGLHINQETFSCSICLDLLKDPASIPCGHSYCMSCIKTHWDGEVGKQSYSCPQCRHRFSLRPVLVKNTLLSVLMEGLKKSGAPAAPLSPSSTTHGHVFCDLCSGTKVKAVKSCLQCLVSYCKEHLQPHYDVAALKKHKLVEPIENLQENMCAVHDEVMKMFCRTDQQCICYLCTLDQHKGHHTVTAAAERTEKQRELQAFQKNILQRISHKEKHLDGLHHHLKNNSGSADAAVEHSDRSLKELLHLLEKRMSLVKQQVRSQQEAEELKVKEVQDKVQQEISELKRKLTEMDTLSHSEDHVHFLHKFASLSKVSESSECVNISQSPPPFQDMVTAAVSKLRSSLQHTSLLDAPAASNKTQVKKTAKTDGLPAGAQRTAVTQQKEQPVQDDSKEVRVVDFAAMVRDLKLRTPLDRPEGIQLTPPSNGCSQQEFVDYVEKYRKLYPNGYFPVCTFVPTPLPPQSIKEFPVHTSHMNARIPGPSPAPSLPSNISTYRSMKNHAFKITWDPRSLNNHLVLSEDKLSVKCMEDWQNRPFHKLHFLHYIQAVGYEYLKGQCYFEVKLSEYYDSTVTVAVALNNMRRDDSTGRSCFGFNDRSWALRCNRFESLFVHNGNAISFPAVGDLVGVFVDSDAGILSFYRQASELDLVCDLVHTVKTTFTKPLLAGIRLECVGSTAEFSQRMFVNTSSM